MNVKWITPRVTADGLDQLGLEVAVVLGQRPFECVLILRRPDDPNDSRPHEPAVKTAERAIPASHFLRAALRASGEPLSSDRADDVIVAIGRHAGVTPLSWHRLRHTWAETMAEVLADQANGMDRLVYLGGWKSSSSASRYIQRAIAKQATASVREYQRKLYELESQPE